MIYFTADTHYCHKNICRGVSDWEESNRGMSCRDFDTIDQMNDAIINAFNKYVKHDDILYHLGDWSFGGAQNIVSFRKKLNVQQIHLCHGNHDHHIESDKLIPTQYGEFRAKGLFCSTQDKIWKRIEGQEFYLNHYAPRIWPGSHKGTIALYGHSHGSIPDYGKSMDVGVDVAYRMFGEYRPFSIEEITRIMNNKQIAFVDHHLPNTNSR